MRNILSRGFKSGVEHFPGCTDALLFSFHEKEAEASAHNWGGWQCALNKHARCRVSRWFRRLSGRPLGYLRDARWCDPQCGGNLLPRDPLRPRLRDGLTTVPGSSVGEALLLCHETGQDPRTFERVGQCGGLAKRPSVHVTSMSDQVRGVLVRGVTPWYCRQGKPPY